jgi:hypothetical protein
MTRLDFLIDCLLAGIELELGPSRIKGFFYISSHFISLHLDIEFRVNIFWKLIIKKKKRKIN